MTGCRVESIAEHIFGVQQLAWLIYSEANLQLDIMKVIAMLSIHETEEVSIGDFTPFCNVSEEDRKKMGDEAVRNLFKDLDKKTMMINLINEFNERKTPEAKLAYLCDKMECDMQAKWYSDEGYCSIENASSEILSDSRVKEIILNCNAKTVADVFIAFDEGKYEGTVFEELISFLKEYSLKKERK